MIRCMVILYFCSYYTVGTSWIFIVFSISTRWSSDDPSNAWCRSSRPKMPIASNGWQPSEVAVWRWWATGIYVSTYDSHGLYGFYIDSILWILYYIQVCLVNSLGKRLRNDRLIHIHWFPLLMDKSESNAWDLCIIRVGMCWLTLGMELVPQIVSHAPLILTDLDWCAWNNRGIIRTEHFLSLVFIESSFMQTQVSSICRFVCQSVHLVKLRVCQHESQSHKFTQFAKSY